MSLLKNAKKTEFKGVYIKSRDNDEIYIIRYTVENKTKTKIVGKKSDNMTTYLAYKIKLDYIGIEKLNAINKKKGIRDTKFDFLFLYEEFFNYRKPFLSMNTNKNYKSHYNKYFKNKFENQEVQSITKEELQKFINNLLESKRPATVEKIINTLKQFFNYLHDKGIISHNPARNLILPKYDNRKYFSLQKKEVKKLISYIMDIEDLQTKAVYMFLLHGRRISEVLTLKLININFNTGVYRVEADDMKAKKTKFWQLEKFQLNIISEYYYVNKKNIDIFLFENPKTKKPLTYTTFFKRHKILRNDLDLEDFTLHNFRHLVGFLMINGGYSLEVIAKVLGHGSIISTQRYSELKIQETTKAYSRTIKDYIIKKEVL